MFVFLDAWGGGADSRRRSSHRAGFQYPHRILLLQRHLGVTRRALLEFGSGSSSEITSYADLPDSVAVGSSHGGNRGVAKSSPSNRDMEPERVVGRSSVLNPTAPLGWESVCDCNSLPPTVPSVDQPSFMVDAIHSSSGRGGHRGSVSLKRHLDDVFLEEAADKKTRKDPYARVFRYNGDTPFVNDERACAEYYFCARNPFTNIPDADDLVHAQELKDMARADAQIFLFSSTFFLPS
ncbi:hypothetical protein DY000_02040716 [Brassica cretica]|uniref:Uncharacterized protein n=1 Tax=Brassica cretica TaxID=69181 RepID=A0ABQ7BCQ4_BRACR|nr:hypothetical protein DY000_02040716 [Brassica cretica]